jgi:formylglycine-generating enzyme
MGRGTEACSDCANGCPAAVSCDAKETPEHDVTVSAFSLDRYEVTVGRFRRYVEAYDSLTAFPPEDMGAHPSIPGTGWKNAFNVNMLENASSLKLALVCTHTNPYHTWNTGNDQLPIDCVTWYEAFAFCIWDGGRLPTEAEWEYAAAGGDQNRVYPWESSQAPSCDIANWSQCVGSAMAVGSYISGQGRWGHMDLAGNVWEFVFDEYSGDWYSGILASGTDVANTTPSSTRVGRGSGWENSWATTLRAAFRVNPSPSNRYSETGFRCARDH